MRYEIAVFAIFLAIAQSALGASVGERALVWAESQRNATLGSVMVARHRLEIAESDLTVSRNVERDISNSKDTAALLVIREAVAVSEQGVIEAKNLLKRATVLLSRQENTITAIKKFAAENNNKALVIPVEGKVRRVAANGVGYSSDEITGPLRAGDRVEVGPGSSARLFVADGNAEIALSQNSNLILGRTQADDSFEALLTEGFGRIKVKANHFLKKKFEVRTPNAAVAVRGTDFSVQSTPTLTRVEVFESIVYVSPIHGGHGVEVHAGEGCDILKDGGIQPVKPLDNQPRENPWNENVRPS